MIEDQSFSYGLRVAGRWETRNSQPETRNKIFLGCSAGLFVSHIHQTETDEHDYKT
jgi:hypothetical protein